MIKTVSYNDFTALNYEQTKNWDQLKPILATFVQTGGNLALPLLYDKEKAPTHFLDWFKTVYKDETELVSHITELFSEKIITHPFAFIVDQEKKTIRHTPNYGLHWMKQNITQFRPLILDAFRQLVKEIETWDLGLEHFTFGKDLEHKRALRQLHTGTPAHLPKYFYDDYNGNEKEEIFIHPLMRIIEELKNSRHETNAVEFYQILFETSRTQDYTQLFKQSPEDVKEACGIRFSIDSDGKDTALYFYDKNIQRNVFLNDDEGNPTYEMLHQIITQAIYNDDIEFIKRHIHTWNIPEIENSKSPYESFLNHSIKNVQLAKLLINHGAVIEKDYIGRDGQTYHHCLFANEKFNLPLLQAIMETKPEYQQRVLNDPQFFYDKFTNNHHSRFNGFSFLRFLTENYQFPLEKFEVMHLAMHLEKFDNLKWVLESGADPRKCEDFIIKALQYKKDGLRYLKQLQKENIFNTFYPDPLFHILAHQNTKEFNTWLEKIPADIFNRHTIYGMPAWWGAKSANMWDITKNNVTDFTQLSKDGLSWYFYRVKKAFKTNYDFREETMVQDMLKRQPNMNWNLSGKDEAGNNVFHHLFHYEQYGKGDIQDKTLALVLEHTQSPIVELLMQENKEGITPLAKALDYEKHSSMGNYYAAKRMLIGAHFKDFPLSQEIKVQYKIYHKQFNTFDVEEKTMRVVDALIELFNNQKEELEYLHLQQKLNQNHASSKKMKI